MFDSTTLYVGKTVFQILLIVIGVQWPNRKINLN